MLSIVFCISFPMWKTCVLHFTLKKQGISNLSHLIGLSQNFETIGFRLVLSIASRPIKNPLPMTFADGIMAYEFYKWIPNNFLLEKTHWMGFVKKVEPTLPSEQKLYRVLSFCLGLRDSR
jgi:hypothetical protein